MGGRSHIPRLVDMIEAIERVGMIIASSTAEAFEQDWEKRWLVERGVEILSEASRHLPEDVKGRHPEIPWRKVAGIGNVLRHSYERIAPDILWKLASDDLEPLASVCRQELALARMPEEQACIRPAFPA